MVITCATIFMMRFRLALGAPLQIRDSSMDNLRISESLTSSTRDSGVATPAARKAKQANRYQYATHIRLWLE